MPRDLTDLMERATSSAPPEPHTAADITRLAVHRQRRRTTGLAAAAAVVVVAVTGLGYGVTRGHDTTPQPADPYRYGQHVRLRDAVPEAGVAEFREVRETLPSVHPAQGPNAPEAQFRDIDAQGRLLVIPIRSDGSPTYRLVDGPGGPVRVVTPPPTERPQGVGAPDLWVDTFTADDRLLWSPSGMVTILSSLDRRVTDLDGGNVVSVQRDFTDIPAHTNSGGAGLRQVWVDGDRVWFSAVTRNHLTFKTLEERVSLFSFDLRRPQDLRRETPTDALDIDVSGGEAVWTDGERVYAEDLSTGRSHRVPVPFGPGCSVPKPAQFYSGQLEGVKTNGSLVALVEDCGDRQAVVVTDLAGRVVTTVDPGARGGIYQIGLSARFLTMGAVGGPARSYVDDLQTGTLVALGDRHQIKDLRPVLTSAGRYVLWYDGKGGHVGEFTD